MRAAALPALVRPFTLLAPAVGAGAGALVAEAATGVLLRPLTLALGLASALLVTCASNAWNQAYDVALDRINKPSRPIPAGHASERDAIVLGHVCALLGLFAAYMTGPWFFACVSAGVFATWIYSAPPLRTKRRTWGALLTISIPRGLLVPVAGWSIVVAPTGAEPWMLGLVGGLFVFGAAVTKDFADVEGDRQGACQTLPVVWGAQRAARFTAPFLVIPFLLYPLGGLLGLLSPSVLWLAGLGGVLAIVGGVSAWLLLRDPADLARRGGNHPAWALMYILLLGAHAGTALVYQLGL